MKKQLVFLIASSNFTQTTPTSYKLAITRKRHHQLIVSISTSVQSRTCYMRFPRTILHLSILISDIQNSHFISAHEFAWLTSSLNIQSKLN
ncbi:hypothetical protein KC349_g82 [Hortaea werneckii]|nr:hypothetical protein KC349_g82 [Hortaea werneckii]